MIISSTKVVKLALKSVQLGIIVTGFVLPILAVTNQASGAELVLRSLQPAGSANGEPQVLPDCANSALKISPCQRVAKSWLRHLNGRAPAFVNAFRAAGYKDKVHIVVLDCSAGIFNNRKTIGGYRNSRHAYGEACDGSFVRVNAITFRYRKAVTDKESQDRRFFVAFLDGWGDLGPGCIPEKGYKVLGLNVGCRPILVDNCGVIDWRERGPRSQYGSTYHLSFCNYANPARAYE